MSAKIVREILEDCKVDKTRIGAAILSGIERAKREAIQDAMEMLEAAEKQIAELQAEIARLKNEQENWEHA